MQLWEIINETGEVRPLVISFVGAGGKTSCMLEMARHWAKQGEKVLVTTSTHLEHPDMLLWPASVDEDVRDIQAKMEKNGWVIAGSSSPYPKKIQGLSQNVWENIKGKADKILIEADGAKRCPVKVPGEKEPVIREETTHIFITAGASALGKPLKEVCFRLEAANAILERSAGDEILTVNLLGKLLEDGYVRMLKEEPEKKLAVLLNQADCLKEPEEVRKELEKCISVPVYLHAWKKSVHFIVLAAGYSKRFGENKLLYEIENKPMYRHLFDRLRKLRQQGKADSLVVVSQYDEIIADVKKQGENAVKNENSADGIASSLKLGLEKTIDFQQEDREHYYMFFVADQPYLKKNTIAEFLSAFFKSGKKAGCLSCEGEAGNPVIFHECYVPELLKLHGDTGGKKVLKKHLGEAFFYETEDKKELKDCDFKEELK